MMRSTLFKKDKVSFLFYIYELERQLMLSNAVGELLSCNNIDSPSVSNEKITFIIK